MESEDHEAGLLVGLAGLRDQGLLLDTCLWAEGEKYQVRRRREGSSFFRTSRWECNPSRERENNDSGPVY